MLSTRLHVGGDGPGVVVRFHHDEPWTKDHQKGEYMLLPCAVDYHTTLCRVRDGIELSVIYAHSRSPARSLSKQDIGDAAPGSAALNQTRTRAVLLSPVGIQAQIMPPGLRIAKRVLFIVPPWRSMQAQPHPDAYGADRTPARIIGSGG